MLGPLVRLINCPYWLLLCESGTSGLPSLFSLTFIGVVLIVPFSPRCLEALAPSECQSPCQIVRACATLGGGRAKMLASLGNAASATEDSPGSAVRQRRRDVSKTVNSRRHKGDVDSETDAYVAYLHKLTVRLGKETVPFCPYCREGTCSRGGQRSVIKASGLMRLHQRLMAEQETILKSLFHEYD
uniref:Uncharacterized protein n=1 Tax=Steinernema glaseri TaxID=37863 RepID=A0A1I7Z4P3_9BILA